MRYNQLHIKSESKGHGGDSGQGSKDTELAGPGST